MPFGENTDPDLERIASQVVDSCFRVHTQLGPGLLESVYEQCLALELQHRGLTIERQVHVPIKYLGQQIDPGLRLDLLVERQVIVEVKAVDTMHTVFHAQLLTYLKLSNPQLGILVNFNVPRIKDSIRRVIN